MSNSFTFAGVDFGALGVTVTRSAQQAGADPKETILSYAEKHGAIMQGRFLKRRNEQWQCLLEADTRTQFIERQRLVVAALRPELGTNVLLPDHEPDIQYYARLNAPVIMEPRGPYAATFQLSWVMPDPFKYSRASFFGDESEATALTTSPQSIFVPFDYGDVVDGTADAQGFIVIRTNAPINPGTITVENKDTGVTIEWTGTLLSGHYLRIRVADDHVERSEDGETWVSAMTQITNASQPSALVVRAGVRTEIEITGVSDGAVFGELRPRWY